MNNLLPVFLSFLIAGTKLLRVPVFLYFLTVQEYSNFIYYLFIFGLFVAFEQMICSIVINAFSNEKNLKRLPRALNKELNFTLFLFQVLSTILLLTNNNFIHGYSINTIFVFICFLNLSLWAYCKIIYYISALEVNGHILQNRYFKLANELIFLCLSIILLSVNSDITAAIMSFTIASLFIYLIARKSLSFFKITIIDAHEIIDADKYIKNYWSQLSIQGTTVLARSIPMLVLAYIGSAEQIAFYFVAAQLYQIGPLILFPILTAQYPNLRVRGSQYDKAFIKVSISTILIIILCYLGLFFNMPWIIDIWTDGKLIIDFKLLLFLNIISIVAAIHIAFKYFSTAKNMSNVLIKCYGYSAFIALLIAFFINTYLSFLDAVFIYSIAFEIIAIIYIFITLKNKYSKI